MESDGRGGKTVLLEVFDFCNLRLWRYRYDGIIVSKKTERIMIYEDSCCER